MSVNFKVCICIPLRAIYGSHDYKSDVAITSLYVILISDE